MSFHSWFATPLLAAALVPMLACSQSAVTSPTTPGTALTALPRELSAAERSVLSASNGFSFALWHRLNDAQRDTNIFVSPLSASFSLGMAMNGASGQTFDEMRSGLQLGTETVGNIDAGYKSLISLLTTLDPSVKMDVANSIWYRSGFPVNQPFLDDAATYFSASVRPLTFTDVSGSLATINAWVKSSTNGRIPSIIDAIDGNDVMFLINAISFKGTWRSRFDPAMTQDGTFHSRTGDQPARLMHREGRAGYVGTSAYDAVDLAYGDSAFSMTVLLPKPGTTVDALAATLTADMWHVLSAALRPAIVDLFLPKLTMTWQRELIPDLDALGMHAPFGSLADFTRMSPRGRELYISAVKQKAFVDIDEEGTEAAAVTSTGVSVTSAVIPSVVRVDRPFVFLIRERLSGTVLFMGKVTRLP